ncbi:hypothetical protein [Rhodococcus sp. ARC_M6]|uniref:hypothetical protein n=1 Tax=Rhodococcus sp. ARC_M6 TaxID=2928852 RepID=UPI001FB4CD14|nr:hypothetical protein [Rhodococcus sp. ARC_M6]MCJ0904490.1 hypothetical protein [Rhodococcus sp. ARC_M6]
MTGRWSTSERVDRWIRTGIVAGFVIILGPLYVGQVISDPTTGNWVVLAVWAACTISIAFGTAQSWKNRNNPRNSRLTSTIDPSKIPVDDVRKAIASTDSRIPAVKALREQHIRLGLKDAADLIDAELGR